MASTPPTKQRKYRSKLREERTAQTRRTVIEAAREVFVAKGWGGAGMREVAAAAGVAIETVYSHFSSKAGLLRAVGDTAVMGDDAPVPLEQRPEFRAMGNGTRSDRIAAAARLLTAVQLRTTPIAKVIRQAAPADEEIGEMLRATRERQRHDIGAAVELIIGRPPTASERDGVWAIASPELYLLLVEESGWTPEQYETWVAETMDVVIPRPSMKETT